VSRLFLASCIAGLAIALALAGFYPLPENQRVRSQIEVLANGGRQETFVIEWPADRISLPAARASDVDVATKGMVVLVNRNGGAAGAELFRLRDVRGNVIGIASRVTGRVPGQRFTSASVTNWTLLIPGRGSLLLSQENSTDVGPVRNGGAPGAYVAAAEFAGTWSRGTRYRITAGPAPDSRGRVIAGTAEFDRLSGDYSEIWELTELNADGTTEGKISISTVMAGRP